MGPGWFRPPNLRALGRFRLAVLALAAIAVVVATSLSLAPAASMPVSTAGSGQTSTVGALFSRTASGRLSHHFCTASVVDSPAGDLVITAAHCVDGLAPSQVAFVPDYSHGEQPYGVWTVSQIIADPQWLSSADPDDDFAFLIVQKHGSGVALQALTGGEIIGIGEPAGRTVKVAGYPDGQDGPITCENAALDFSPTQLQFDCGGFTDGTSGSPMLAGSGSAGRASMVIGVIGGYQQGGDTPSVSYAARFGMRMAALYQTALAAASH
jgi:V8-like Glu-specific endopeptidase